MPPAPEQLQWVRYNPGAALFEFLRVSRTAELAHRRLADHYWQTGEWASVPTGNAATLCRADPGEWPALLVELGSLGWQVRRQRLCNSGVQQVREEAVSAVRLGRDKARRAARQRWDGQGARERKPAAKPSGPAGPPNSRGNAQAKPKQCSTNAQAMLKQCPSNAQPILKQCPSNAQAMPKQCASNAQAMHSKVNSKVQDKQESTILNTFNAERLTFIVSAQEKSAQGEKEFLKEVEETFARCSPKAANDELTNWGGWWRNRFRENAAKARIVLADLASMIREGRILTNPGAAAVDLWSRLPQ